MVVSNHEAAERLARFYEVPFHCVPVGSGKRDAEQAQLGLLRAHGVELVVLARYM